MIDFRHGTMDFLFGTSGHHLAVARCLGNGRAVDGISNGRLSTHTLVRSIVEEHMDVVPRMLACDDAKCSSVHDESAVAIEAENAAMWLFQGDAQCDA